MFLKPPFWRSWRWRVALSKLLIYLAIGFFIGGLAYSVWRYPTTCAIPAEHTQQVQKVEIAEYWIENYTATNHYIILYAKKHIVTQGVLTGTFSSRPSKAGPFALEVGKTYVFWCQCQRCLSESSMGFVAKSMKELPGIAKYWSLKLFNHNCKDKLIT